MSYTTVSVIVSGALDEETDFENDTELNTYLARIKTEDFGGEFCEVYTLHHDHDPLWDNAECACVQYLQDHKPYWTNKEQES